MTSHSLQLQGDVRDWLNLLVTQCVKKFVFSNKEILAQKSYYIAIEEIQDLETEV